MGPELIARVDRFLSERNEIDNLVRDLRDALVNAEKRLLSMQEQALAVIHDTELREALKVVLEEYDRNTCTHDETHRGGAIWTICDGCGAKWADDRGGFKPYEDPPKIARARKLLDE